MPACPPHRLTIVVVPSTSALQLTDRSPELRKTLLSLLYKDGARFQFSRLQALLLQAAKVKALGQMRQQQPTGRGAGGGGGSQKDGSSLKLLLSPEGDLVRDILLDEVAKVGAWGHRGYDSYECRQRRHGYRHIQ